MTVQALSQTKLKKDVDPFNFVKLSDVAASETKWLWKPYIPRGALTMIMGDGGYGKSWMTCAIAADLSQGRALPGQEALPPMRTLMISAEDGISQIIKPKMELLKANMDMIMASDAGFALNDEAMIHLVRYINDYDVAIVFLDPVVVYLGGRIDMNRSNETRSWLTRLSDVAKDTNTAIVAVHHVRKSGEGSKQHKVMGSADFVNGVRSTLLTDVSKGGQRFMAHVKSNWAANGPTLAYEFGDKGFTWMGTFDAGPDVDLPEVSTSRRGAVQEWLRSELKHGPQRAVDMLHRAGEAGYSERTIARAKKGMVVSYNEDQVWYWSLTEREVERLQAEELYVLNHAPVSGDVAVTPETMLKMHGATVPDMFTHQKQAHQETDTPSDPLAAARALIAQRKANS